MKNFIFLFAAFIFIAINVSAQKGIETGTQYGSGQDSIRCLENISLFIGYAQSKNYEDAYTFWKPAYEECPASHINIYLIGTTIINWQISQETDPAKREELINAMIKLYDDRIKYFGEDPRYKKDVVVFRKAQTYNQLKGVNTDFQLIYKWLGEMVEEFKENSDKNVLSLYMFSSLNLMQSDIDKYKEQYINDFLKCSAIFDIQIDAVKAAGNDKEAEDDLISRKKEIEQFFATSGAANCETLQNIYASKVEENKNNIEVLKEAMAILFRVGCNESDAFIAASEYAYKLEPSAQSAMGLGSKAFRNNDFATAEKYFNEAIAMSDDSEEKANGYLLLVAIASDRGQHQTVKQLAQKCVAENPNKGRAYIFWAMAYASGGRNLFGDEQVLNKLIWYAVVEKLEKARQVDPSVSGEANKLINQYRQYFPSQDDLFMHPQLNKVETFTLPGWVNEVVRIRRE